MHNFDLLINPTIEGWDNSLYNISDLSLTSDIFGGVSALTTNQFEKVNGFSNQYWGWGGEDDDMSRRVKANNFTIIRYKPDIARYIFTCISTQVKR